MSASGDNIENATVDALCKNIQSTDRIIRQKALNNLLQIVSFGLEPSYAKELFDTTYLHIIKCYSDKFETSRSLATSIFSKFIESLPTTNDHYLGYLVPVLKRRIGMKEIVEESEEMRLQLMEQLLQIVDKFKYKNEGEDHLLSSYNDIMDILLKTLTDPYSAVQQQACHVIKIMPKATPFQGGKIPPMAPLLINLLKHRHSPIRILAIETIGVVGLHVNNKDDLLYKLIGGVNILALDMAPRVRLACGRVGCLWMLKMADRYSFFGHILPMVLLCLIDENADTREEIGKQFVDVGEQYYEENESDMQKIALTDDPAPNYSWINKPRPSMACRHLVARRFQQIRVVANEMQDWKEEVRLHSLKLLSLIVLYSEENFYRHFEEIYPSLVKCCQDTDGKVVKEATYVAKLIGTFLMFEFWFDRKLLHLRDMKGSTAVGVLRCFSAMFSGAYIDTKMHEVERLSGLLSYWEVVHNLNPQFQMALLEFTEQLLDLYFHKINIGVPLEEDCDCEQRPTLTDKVKPTADKADKKQETTEKNSEPPKFHKKLEERFLLQILVKIISFANGIGDEKLCERASAVLNKLAGSTEYLETLYEEHIGDFIELIQDLELEHSERSDRILLLSGCLSLCGFRRSYFNEAKSALKTILNNSEPNAKIKILSSISIAMIDWTQNMQKAPLAERTEFISSFMQEIFEPCLTWQAGRSAESIRTMTTQALCAMAQGASDECKTIFPKYGVIFNALMDDSNAVTRTYALRALMKSGPFATEEYSKLAMSVLDRLDDPCSDCRLLAVKCVSLLDYSDASHEQKHEPEVLIKHIISKLILHLDDPDIKLSSPLMDSLTKLALKHATIGKELIEKIPDSPAHKEQILELKSKLMIDV